MRYLIIFLFTIFTIFSTSCFSVEKQVKNNKEVIKRYKQILKKIEERKAIEDLVNKSNQIKQDREFKSLQLKNSKKSKKDNKKIKLSKEMKFMSTNDFEQQQISTNENEIKENYIKENVKDNFNLSEEEIKGLNKYNHDQLPGKDFLMSMAAIEGKEIDYKKHKEMFEKYITQFYSSYMEGYITHNKLEEDPYGDHVLKALFTEVEDNFTTKNAKKKEKFIKIFYKCLRDGDARNKFFSRLIARKISQHKTKNRIERLKTALARKEKGLPLQKVKEKEKDPPLIPAEYYKYILILSSLVIFGYLYAKKT